MHTPIIFLTGATGIMGFESLKHILTSHPGANVRLLARRSKKNLRKLAPYMKMSNVDVVWGNLLNYDDVDRAMGNADIVLHLGGMVSPQADHYPQATMNVNILGARNIATAALTRGGDKEPKVVYIGSIAETGSRDYPYHRGRIGDPVLVSPYDYYGLSKVIAEREIVESGLRRWVVLRQSGILHSGLLFKGMDSITFHVPLRGVIEWATLEDSGRLMANICSDEVPDAFWNNFYHISSGEEFRLSNYDFEKRILKALNCPAPEKIFEPSWFATRNFHGLYFEDADKLEELLHFRENVGCDEYFRRMTRHLPWYFSVTRFVPAWIMKFVMKTIAKRDGTLSWLQRSDREDHIRALFGSRAMQMSIPGWKDFDVKLDETAARRMNHGYDEEKLLSELDLHDMQRIAEFRGGRCLSATMTRGDMRTPLEWECAFGHRFKASPMLVVRGGHWCPDCLPAPWRYDEEARVNPFLAQVWYAGHSPEERCVYDSDSKIVLP